MNNAADLKGSALGSRNFTPELLDVLLLLPHSLYSLLPLLPLLVPSRLKQILK